MNIFERRWAALTRREVTTATGKATRTTVGARSAMAAHSNDAATSEQSGQDEKPPESRLSLASEEELQ
jgi:hypothetical protein